MNYKQKGKVTRGRSYSEEYKENVIQLATSGDRTPRQVAKDLGIPPRTLYTWLQVRGLTGTTGRPADKPRPINKDNELLALRAKVAELEREKCILEEEREILKKGDGLLCKRAAVIDTFRATLHTMEIAEQKSLYELNYLEAEGVREDLEKLEQAKGNTLREVAQAGPFDDMSLTGILGAVVKVAMEVLRPPGPFTRTTEDVAEDWGRRLSGQGNWLRGETEIPSILEQERKRRRRLT